MKNREATKTPSKKRAPRTGQAKLQCDPLGCEAIVEGFMEEFDLSQAEALRRIIWQWYWLVGDPDRPVVIIDAPDPGTTQEQKARQTLINRLGIAANNFRRAEEAFRRFSTELHDVEAATRFADRFRQIATQYAGLYSDARAGLVPYLHIIPPEYIIEALEIEAKGGSTTRAKFVLASLFSDGGLR